MTSPLRVLSLYRAILKLGRSWKGDLEEKQYILSEAKKVFRQNKDASSPEEVESLIEEGNHRLNYAQHYGIAYPRLHHASQFKPRMYMDIPQQASGDAGAVSLPSDQDSAAKLAAAIQRRKAVTVTKDDWLLIAGKRKRGDEIIAFSERFKLPPNVDLTGIKAKAENGELVVTIPKTPSPVVPEVVDVPIE